MITDEERTRDQNAQLRGEQKRHREKEKRREGEETGE